MSVTINSLLSTLARQFTGGDRSAGPPLWDALCEADFPWDESLSGKAWDWHAILLSGESFNSPNCEVNNPEYLCVCYGSPHPDSSKPYGWIVRGGGIRWCGDELTKETAQESCLKALRRYLQGDH